MADVARMLTLTTKDVVDVLSVFQTFDPILKRKALPTSALVEAARKVWDEYANDTQNMNDKKGKGFWLTTISKTLLALISRRLNI